MPVPSTVRPRTAGRFDNAETTEVDVTVGRSQHPRFDGKPAADLSFLLASGQGGCAVTIYDPEVLDRLAAQASSAAAEMRAATTRLLVGLVAFDDEWDNQVTNPLGCCRSHRPNGVDTPQQHGGPGCWWPGPKKGTRVVARTHLGSSTAVRGTVVEVYWPGALSPSVPEVLVAWDEPVGGTIRGTLGVFAQVDD